MPDIHLIIPFSRPELKDKLIEAYRPMGVILHFIMFQDEIGDDFPTAPWIVRHYISGNSSDCKVMMPGTFKRNWLIQNSEIYDDDYYVTADDDDMYEAGVFDAIKQMDDDIVIISMKRGYQIPPGTPPLRQYPTWTLEAKPENVRVGYISAQQSFVKGKIFKEHLHNEESHNWDGELAVHHKEDGEQIAYRPDLYALFNYFEPGRWEKPKTSRLKVSNLKLAIGIPCTFPFVPLKFYTSFALMEKPDHIFLHADNGPVSALRNNLVSRALAEGATRLIMMDVDQVYHPQTITRLLSHHLPVVGCLVHRRYPPFDSLMLKLEEMDGPYNRYKPIEEWEDGELVEVDATGAGCLMFDMAVFRKLPKPWFKDDKAPEGTPPIGEDIGFCQDLKAAGYRIFVDTSVPAGHLTTMIVNTATANLYKAMKTEQWKKNLALGVESVERRNDGKNN